MSYSHDELVEIGRGWLLRPWRNASEHGHGGCALVLTEITTSAQETPDAIGWHESKSILLEAKTSRADFIKDRKKSFRRYPDFGMGRQRYYIAPKGLIAASELPAKWGLIEVLPSGATRVAWSSKYFETDMSSELKVMLSLIRRLKIDSGKHVAIRAYTIEQDKEPRATVTTNWEEFDAEGKEQETPTPAADQEDQSR